MQPVEHQQQSGDQAEAGRAGQTAAQARHHHDHQRPDDGRGDPPAGGVHPDEPLAESDQPLADLGVHDHRRVVLPQPAHGAVEDLLVGALHVAAHVAVVDQRPRVLGVVGLVELELRGRAQAPQPQEQRDQAEPDRGAPAHERVLDPQPAARAGSRLGRGDGPPVGGARELHPLVPVGQGLLGGVGAHDAELYGRPVDPARITRRPGPDFPLTRPRSRADPARISLGEVRAGWVGSSGRLSERFGPTRREVWAGSARHLRRVSAGGGR